MRRRPLQRPPFGVLFQFTHPGRGATPIGLSLSYDQWVSIHAPREGCDCSICGGQPCGRCFNSRTPGGVRPKFLRHAMAERRFQFTHPGRGATRRFTATPTKRRSFNSRTPGGVRQAVRPTPVLRPRPFQFTHPGRGATSHSPPTESSIQFQFTHPGRGATIWGR